MRERIMRMSTMVAKPAVALTGAVLIAGVLIALAVFSGKAAPSGHYATATRGSITAVAGGSSDLSFPVSGQVARVPAAIGSQVNAGTVLVALDQSALLASRAGAVANEEAAEARLAALTAGTRDEQIAIYTTNVTQAEAVLRDTVRTAYVNADDAVHNKADQFFINPRSSQATLSFTFSGQVLQDTLQSERVALETTLGEWGSIIHASDYRSSDPLSDADVAQTSLAQVAAFLDTAATVLANVSYSSSLPPATVQGYQSNINAARLSISNSVSAITGATTALQTARGVLTLAQAGPTNNDVSAAQAAVDAAKATLAGIDVALRQSALIAPTNGTVTTQNAHVGQTVVPGQVLVSIESTGGSKQDALVIPKSSVIVSDGQAFVYTKGATAPVKTPVSTGLASDTMIEITAGLTAGDQVLTFGGTN